MTIDHTQGQGTGNGRIDRIAPVAQGLQARLGGHRIHGCDQTLARCGGFSGTQPLASKEGLQREQQQWQDETGIESNPSNPAGKLVFHPHVPFSSPPSTPPRADPLTQSCAIRPRTWSSIEAVPHPDA